MSFNFTRTPVTTGTTGFTFGTPAGDAKTSKEGYSLFGSTTTTQSSNNLRFASPTTASVTPGVSVIQSPPLFGTSTFSSPFQSTLGTGTSMFGVNKGIPSSFGITATTASQPLALGATTIQPVRPSFSATDESTFKTHSSGLLGSTFPPFGSTNTALQSAAPSFGGSSSTALQSTVPSFGLPQSTFSTPGSIIQTVASNATALSNQIIVPSFSVPAQPNTVTTFPGGSQSLGTSVATPQFSFGNSALAKPRMSVAAAVVPTSNFAPALPVPSFMTPKASDIAVQPTLPYMNLGSTTAITTPTLSLSSPLVTLTTAPAIINTTAITAIRTPTSTTTSTSITTASTVSSFGSGILPGLPTIDSNLGVSMAIPHATATIAEGGALTSLAKGKFATSATAITAPMLKFGETTTISTGASNALDPSSMATGTSSLGMTTSITVPSIKSSISTGRIIPEANITGTNIVTTTTDVTSTLMTYGQLEDFINKWTLDLENQSKIFANQAKQLNAWDRLLISNGDKILQLNSSIERVKEQQNQLDQELDFIRAQQKELEHLIVPLEKELQEAPVTDTDRNHTYQLAENIDSQLKQMSEDLKEIIETLNESNKKQELTNPITQIGRILNAHMNSLQWIDINTNKITNQLDQISKMHDKNKRNHEITLQRTYD